MAITHWIYPTNERSNYYLVKPNGNIEVSPHRLLEDIEQSPDKLHPWVLTTGFRVMRPGDAIWIYAAGPYQYICALAQAVDIYPDGKSWSVTLLWSFDATGSRSRGWHSVKSLRERRCEPMKGPQGSSTVG